jgi:hypothetical protein
MIDSIPAVGPVPDLYPYVRTLVVTDRYEVGPIRSDGCDGVLVTSSTPAWVYVDDRRVGRLHGEIEMRPTNSWRVEFVLHVIPDPAR